jgi:hypothetical protein
LLPALFVVLLLRPLLYLLLLLLLMRLTNPHLSPSCP